MRLALKFSVKPLPQKVRLLFTLLFTPNLLTIYMFSFASNQDNTTKATLDKRFSIQGLRIVFIAAIHVAFFRTSSHRSAKPDIANSHVPLETADSVTQRGSEEVEAYGVNRDAGIQILWQSA